MDARDQGQHSTELDLSERAAVDFVLLARQAWATMVFPELTRRARARNPVPPPPAGRNEDPPWMRAALGWREAVHAEPLWQFFAWAERNLQKQLWRTIEPVGRRQAALDWPTAPPDAPGTLELDPDLELPRWYRELDFHIQPGGVWSSRPAAMIYRLGAKVVMLGGNDAGEFHERFVASAIPARSFRRIVDLGCGFAKSTFPLAKAHPEAEVIGVDLAAPLLELAHAEAGRRGLAITFRQANAEATGLETASADLVTSTMLLHELPPKALSATLTESARLLEPGGVLAMLDYGPIGEPFHDLAMLEHAERNNEPYMDDLFAAPVLEWCNELGFVDAKWLPFDERGPGLVLDGQWPKRAEWHFPWVVLLATKAEHQ
jgi:SAM-dependent methyltransferase